MSEPRITRENVGDYLDVAHGAKYQKKVPITAVRMVGPFVVDTSEGTLRCQDGYLCIDSRGYPYPVAADEFHAIYGPVE